STRRLETAILNRDPKLDVTSSGHAGAADRPATSRPEPHSAVPRRLPATIADFTGRQGQLAEITHVLGGRRGETEAYGMRIVSISGKGGVGKSTLALRAAHELRDAYPDGHLYGDLEGAGSDEDRVRGVLARFLRALGVDGNAMPDDDEERGDLYRSRVANKKVLVVLDGATDESQVIPLLPAGPGCAVIVTSRTRLSGLPGALQIAIDVFDSDHSLQLLATIAGADRVRTEEEPARELVELCGGLPLAIRIAGARLASRAHWRVDMLVNRLRDNVRRLDELSFRGLVLRTNISQSYEALEPVGQRLFRLFALVTTPDFPGWIAAPLLDIDPFDAVEVVESLVDAQLLDTVRYPGEGLRYRFHDLIRVFATEQLDTAESAQERTAAVERLVGAWLARAEHAHRKEYGGDYTILHGTAPRWSRAPELEEADEMGNQIEWLERERRSLVSAVRLAADNGMAEAAWDLTLTSVTLFQAKGYFDDWRDTVTRALAAAENAGNERGRAAMLYSLGSMYAQQQNRLDEAERCSTAALEIFERLADEHGCALALRNLATLDRMRHGTAATMARYELALAKMRAVGDMVGQAHTLQHMAKMCIDEGDADRALALLEAALARCREVGYLRGEAQVLNRFAELHLLVNQVEEAHQALNRVLLIVRDIGDRIGEAHALYRLGVVRQRSGRLDNAETTLQHALSLAHQVGQRMVTGTAHLALGEIAVTRNRETVASDHIETALALFTEFGAPIWQA
ncbi:MAG: tetratricopeptide repeat protein, partial [Actinomycetota bacterium]|nr:tetratricopeptide repeat protein [Actinomycetota bacterium]